MSRTFFFQQNDTKINNFDEGVMVLKPFFWVNVIFKIRSFCIESQVWGREEFLWVAPPHCNAAKYVMNASLYMYNAVVTPLRKAASYEPRIAILGIWGDTWLTRGKYCIYVAVRGRYGALTGSTWRLLESGENFCHVKSALSTVVSRTWR